VHRERVVASAAKSLAWRVPLGARGPGLCIRPNASPTVLQIVLPWFVALSQLVSDTTLVNSNMGCCCISAVRFRFRKAVAPKLPA
jgi:hypothetical protein